MTVKELREALLDYPDDASVELGKLMVIKETEDSTEAWEVALDSPIVGLAYHAEANDVRLCISPGEGLEAYGMLSRIKPIE